MDLLQLQSLYPTIYKYINNLTGTVLMLNIKSADGYHLLLHFGTNIKYT